MKSALPALVLALTSVSATGQATGDLSATPPVQPVVADNVPPLSDAEQAALSSALERGRLLYRYDQAAWHSTDRLTADVPRARLATIRGWVVVPKEDGLRVIYYDGDAAPHHAVWSATWTGGTRITDARLHAVGDDMLDAEAARLVALRDTISLSDFRFCARARPNIVILPASATGSTDSVYLLTPQVDDGIPFGGHHRIDFADGREVARRAFTNSCITLQPQANGGALFISHLLDPVPTEIHAFSALASRQPVFVAIADGQRLFGVEPAGNQPRVRILPLPAN